MLPDNRIRKPFVNLINLVSLFTCLFAVASVTATNLGLAGDDGQDQILQPGSLNQGESDNNLKDYNFHNNQHHERHAEIYLEGIDDLDHLSYLAMRNYNLTDDRLLQSTWLTGANQLEAAQHVQDDSATGSMGANEPNNRLAFILESLILHLKNGHLRRMSLEDLERTVNGHNLTESFELMRKRLFKSDEKSANSDQQLRNSDTDESKLSRHRSGFDQPGDGQTSPPNGSDSDRVENDYDSELRCLLLVTLYKFDLAERARAQATAIVFPSNLQPTKPDEESSPLQFGSNTTQPNETLQLPTSKMEPEQSATMGPVSAHADEEWRLIKLCKLAVYCHSSEELVNLISRPWKTTNIEGNSRTKSDSRPELHEKSSRLGGTSPSQSRINLERESTESIGGNNNEPEATGNHRNELEEKQEFDESNMRLRHRKNLRDSVSLSLAKLCPLILFPLHEEDGQCMVRRDDRPPMITVWAFATLFVTIVCFCSLIGLSITPLIGHFATDFSANSSDTNGPAVFSYLPNFLFGPRSSPNSTNDKHNRHRASLTLFEGLAVGSLVGSALFSLLPQAFELQERESNQSFLLKAFIIFSGIYLFFLSERIMRIILDTRQKRKRKKRLLTHRSSTTAAVELTEDAHHQHHLDQLNHHRHLLTSSSGHHLPPQQSISSLGQGQGGGSLSQSRPSTSSRGSGAAGGATAKSFRQRRLAVTSQSGGSGSVLAPVMARMPQRIDERSQVDEIQVIFQTSDNKNPIVRKHKRLMLMTTTDDDRRQHREKPLSEGDRDGQRKQTRNRATGKHNSRSRRTARVNKQSNQNRKISNSTMSRTRTRVQNQSAGRQRRSKQVREDNTKQQASDQKRTRSGPESGPHDGRYHYKHQPDSTSPTLSYFSSSSSRSSSPSSSSSSFSSYVFHENGRLRLASSRNGMLTNALASDSQVGYSSHSDSESVSICSSCPAYASEYCAMVAQGNNLSDSDDDNDQRRAVTKRMSELTHHRMVSNMNSSSCEKTRGQDRLGPEQQVGSFASTSSQPRTTFEFNSLEPEPLLNSYNDHTVGQGYCGDLPWFETKTGKKNANGSHQNKQRDISTVAWMIILGDGLHNFIDGISIGAAFSESILSGVSISVAVICEEFPHELGDFAVLISSGMTVRQALGYNFLSACTCYFGMAVGIILGDVTDGASYISALAAGVFLYIALVDMMGELSAALESSSRYSIAKTLKLLLLQNVGIAIGISIIFVLSFIDF